MARVSFRIYQDDREVGRIDAELPAEAPEIVAACREWVDEWVAASRPMSEEEVASFEKVFEQAFGEFAGARAKEALSERLLKERERRED